MDKESPWWLPWLKAPFLSAFGLFATQFLIGSGVPLDRWARDAGAAMALHMSLEQAAWGVSALVALVLFLLGTYWTKLRSWLAPRHREPADLRSARVGVLSFVHKPSEHQTFTGGFGADLHVSAVIVNNDRKSAVDAHVDLIRVQRINKPNDHGQPHIDGLPRRLVSDKANEFQTIAPEREQAFALCAKHEKLERDAVLVLAPGSKGDPLAVLPPGSYFLHVVASAHDTPPTRATFKVDISHLGMGYRLCTPEEVAAPETIPTIRAHTSIVALLDHDDFKKYDGCRRFELYEAACLWAGERPALPLSPTSERHFRELEAAVQNDQLAVLRDLNEALADAYDLVVHGKKTKANPHWKVDREDLLARANALGEKPPFLFPRERV